MGFWECLCSLTVNIDWGGNTSSHRTYRNGDILKRRLCPSMWPSGYWNSGPQRNRDFPPGILCYDKEETPARGGIYTTPTTWETVLWDVSKVYTTLSDGRDHSPQWWAGPQLDLDYLDMHIPGFQVRLWSHFGTPKTSWVEGEHCWISVFLFPMWPHCINHPCLLSTVNLTLLIGLLILDGWNWFGTQVVTSQEGNQVAECIHDSPLPECERDATSQHPVPAILPSLLTTFFDGLQPSEP